MKKIDIHTHILPPKMPRFMDQFGYGGFIELEHHAPCRARMVRDDGKFFREIENNYWDAKVRLLECNEMGIERQVLSTVPILFNYWARPQDGLVVSQFLNDHIASVFKKNPARFSGLATLPMQDPDLACKELERCMKLGFAGIEIGSHINDWNLNAPQVFQVLQTAERLGACVFVHPWDMMGENRMPQYWLPWLVGMPAELSLAICSMIFGGVFEKLPKLRVAFAHGGGAFPGTIGRIENGFQTRPDLCGIDNPHNPRSYLGKFWVDSLVYDPAILQSIIQLFGEDRILLGSDYPLCSDQPSDIIDSLELPKKTRNLIYWNNALTWLGQKYKK